MTEPEQPSASAGPSGAADLDAEARKIASGHAFPGPALELGALLHGGRCLHEAPVGIPLGMLDRHGLVAGATGTGNTKTLQLVAEQLSANGVPVFLADMKGSSPASPRPARAGRSSWGVPRRWARSGRRRDSPPGSTHWAASATAFRSVRPSRTSVRTQEQSLGLIFHYADPKGLELVDPKDLRGPWSRSWCRTPGSRS